MSHYIVASTDEEEYDLSNGFSSSSIWSISETGFDIYEMYDSFNSHYGTSGAGVEKEISLETAEKAYLHAVAWTISLQQYFPVEYKQLVIEDPCRFINVEDFLFAEIFDKSVIKEKIIDIQEYYSDLKEDAIKRSFYLLPAVLKFTYKVYEYAKNGKNVKIYFG